MANEDVNFVHSLYAQANASTKESTNFFFYLIIIFFIGAITWATFSKIDELARGEGKVIPSEKIQTIQSLDGGILADILVKEGMYVQKEQPLLLIDTTRFKASLQENKEASYALHATKIRLEAEYKLKIKNKKPKLKFSKELNEKAPALIKSEKEFFYARVEEHKSSLIILENQLGQKVQELIEIISNEAQAKETKKLVEEEFDTIEKLVRSGSKSKIDLINIKKELNIINGEIRAAKATIPKAKLSISEAKNRILEKIRNFRSEALSELQLVNAEIKKYESILISEEDKLDKTIVKSPVEGYIKVININTVGGVIKSGQDLIEIVPKSDILLVEAKIDPKDIAFINPKQKTIVKITAYDFSIYGGLEGNIVEISADSLIDKDDKNQKSYYRVLVKTNKNYLEKNGEKLPIIPGMIASVDIITGQKTILDFLLKPILKTKQDALHER